MSHPKYQGGSLTSPKETPGDPRGEEEEDRHHTPQDHLQAVEEAVEEAAGEEEHSRCLDTPPFRKLKSF